MITLKNILCPLDYSECSAQALRHAVTMALKDRAKLFLMHVIDSRIYDYGGPLYEIPKPDEKAVERLKEKLMESVPQEIRPDLRVEAIVTVGIPVDEIVRVAKEKSIDMIVMGTHGRTGLAHVVLGSIAENVVRRAPCPVLTVRRS